MAGDDGWFTTAWHHEGADAADNCKALCWACYEQANKDTCVA
jgi:hypothetical protein